jgi:hypothetical protein
MRKALLIIAIVVLALAPFAAYMLIAKAPARAAASGDVEVTAANQELTEQQKTDLETSYQKMIDLKKETINTFVQDGLLTEEQGKLALERLDQLEKKAAEDGYVYGYGTMRGCLGGVLPNGGGNARGGYGRGGMMRGYDRDWN